MTDPRTGTDPDSRPDPTADPTARHGEDVSPQGRGAHGEGVTSPDETGSRVRDRARQARPAAAEKGHGSTPAAWTTVILLWVAFIIGGFAVVTLRWQLGVLAVVVLVAGAVAGRVMSMMGLGQTMSYTDTASEDAAEGRTQPGTARPDGSRHSGG